MISIDLFGGDAGELLAGQPVRVAGGATWSEGPCYVPHLNSVLWSDIPGNRILRYDLASGETSVHRTDVEFTNGRALDHHGDIVQCSHGRRAIEREHSDGRVDIIVDSYNGVRLNSPNDVVVASDQAIWFTDPPYGIKQAHEGHLGDMEYGGCYVFRYDEARAELRPVITDVEEPNGLAFSPDESILYVADTSAALRTDGGGNRHIVAYRVDADWNCERIGVFATCQDGLFDGFRVDQAGNVWTSAGAGIDVYAPSGARLLRITMPDVVGNLCFVGSDIYVAASDALWRLPTRTTEGKAHG